MFLDCNSLKELNISNFVFNDNCSMFGMFLSVSNGFKNKIKAQNKNIKDEAFE